MYQASRVPIAPISAQSPIAQAIRMPNRLQLLYNEFSRVKPSKSDPKHATTPNIKPKSFTNPFQAKTPNISLIYHVLSNYFLKWQSTRFHPPTLSFLKWKQSDFNLYKHVNHQTSDIGRASCR